MEIHIDTPMFILLSLFSIIFLPYLHLCFIFLIMGICEWLYKLCKKIEVFLLNIYDIISYIISSPIFLTGFIIYLYMLIV